MRAFIRIMTGLTLKEAYYLIEEIMKRFHFVNLDHNNSDIRGIGMEVLGGMSKNGSKLLNRLCAQIELRTNIKKSVLINRFRSKLVAIMWKQQAKMILECYEGQW